jgi:hypothetical protein
MTPLAAQSRSLFESVWTVAWSIYHLAYARCKFGHGAEWRSQEDAVTAETAAALQQDRSPMPLPDAPA